MTDLNMVNLGYVLAIGLLGWVAGVHASRLLKARRIVRTEAAE